MQKRTDNFSKFTNQKKGSAIKEAMRQEKRKVKAEARAAGEEMREKKKAKARGEVWEKPDNNRGKPISKGISKVDKHVAGERPHKVIGDKRDVKPNATKQSTPAVAIRNQQEEQSVATEQMPLNKYIAHAGVCGRREAAELVKAGKVTVNGDKIFEPGLKVTQSDKVVVKGKAVFLQKNSVYILLNKPKDFITTASDPQGRKTVLDLIKHATPERVYPVGRLDRNTTGVLLLTNDGELAQKLTHPSFEVKKIYEVTLDKPVTKKDLDLIVSGVTLEDGFVAADSVGYADTKTKNVVGIEIHSGRNRIVRRIFEHLGYDVKALDRVMFANLTKKNVERSKWRFLNEKEVRLLKFMNKSFIRKNKTAE
jgi:23S rRNA pseudouridine2605 synthase